MVLSEVLLYSGFVMMGIVFLFFRKPGVTLLEAGSIWKANNYYKPVGVKLYYISILVGGAGIYLTYFTNYSGVG